MKAHRLSTFKQRLLVLSLVLVLALPVMVASIHVCLQIRQNRLDHAIIMAARSLDAPKVETLLRGGASANARDTGEHPSPLSSLLELIGWLHVSRSWPPPRADEPPLVEVFATDLLSQSDREAGDSIACALIGHGADYHGLCVNQDHENLLAMTASYGLHRTLRHLLARGVNVNIRDRDGETPLMVAVQMEDLESVQVLLDNGGDARAVDQDGHSMVYWASWPDDGSPHAKQILRLLKQHGAQLNYRDTHERGK